MSVSTGRDGCPCIDASSTLSLISEEGGRGCQTANGEDGVIVNNLITPVSDLKNNK